MKKKDNIFYFNAYDVSDIFNISYHNARAKIGKYAKQKTYITENELRFVPNIDLKSLDDRIEFIHKFGV